MHTYQYNDTADVANTPAHDTGVTKWIAAANEQQADAYAAAQGWEKCGGEIFNEDHTGLAIAEGGGGLDVVLLHKNVIETLAKPNPIDE
jgi:hypothetical protein